MKKIGFCCKWIDTTSTDSKTRKTITESMNQKTTTQKYLRSLSTADQHKKIFALVEHNCLTLWRQLEWLAQQPEHLRLFRITSEFLPLYTVKEFFWIYGTYQIQELVTKHLEGVRNYADRNNIRLCMHPGQFTNLCSTNPKVVSDSIEDFEYHAMLARLMGYGDTWHSSGFAINIHANIRQDPGLKNIRRIIANDLSETARNLITLENDEYSCGMSDFLNAGCESDVALVLDIHHHWVSSKGIHVSAKHADVQAFMSSWRNIRPLGHFSMPSPDIIPSTQYNAAAFPNYSNLVAVKGISSSTLRAHSHDMWNTALMDWACEHLVNMDIEVEAKGKNVASRQLYDHAVSNKML